MRKRAEPIPVFRSEAEERRFWESHDSADYLDWSQAERVQLPEVPIVSPTIRGRR
jgi:hypothetical protein